KFTNLKKLILYFEDSNFNPLQCVKFSQLEILKFDSRYPNTHMLIKFLEINGKNLTEFDVTHVHFKYEFCSTLLHLLNLTIAKFCPNLKILSTTITKEIQLETLKLILKNCQYLKIIKILYNSKRDFICKNFFNVLTKYSQRNFYELRIVIDYFDSDN